MELICTSCKQVLAKVEVLIPFGAAVSCGECGVTSGHQMLPDDASAPVLSRDEEIAKVEEELETLADKLKQLKAVPGPTTAVAGE